jgi:hypothetical protein
MLPQDRPSGPLRRAVQYFGLANEPDARFRRRERESRPSQPVATASATGESSRTEDVARGLRTLAVYFGLAEAPDGPARGRSRYGQTSTQLDRDIDELRAPIAELEARLGQHSEPS